jgi:hypothetical protein
MFTKYMGTLQVGSDFQKHMNHLVETIKAMNIKIASYTFVVRYKDSLTSNACCSSFKSVWVNGGQKYIYSVAEIQSMEDAASFDKNTQRGGSEMSIGPGAFQNPMYALDSQCLIETFLHELAHHAAGAFDDEDGGTCYGMNGVNRLKALGPARAVRNAENVAFFCMNWVTAINP